jgi:hypothetical protein
MMDQSICQPTGDTYEPNEHGKYKSAFSADDSHGAVTREPPRILNIRERKAPRCSSFGKMLSTRTNSYHFNSRWQQYMDIVAWSRFRLSLKRDISLNSCTAVFCVKRFYRFSRLVRMTRRSVSTLVFRRAKVSILASIDRPIVETLSCDSF